MKRIHIGLLIATIFLGTACRNTLPDTLILPTKKEKGWGHMSRSFVPLTFFDEHDTTSGWSHIHIHPRNIPDTLTDIEISVNPVSWQQFVYQNYRNGILPDSFFRELYDIWNMDTTLLTGKEIRCFFCVVLGKDKKGKTYYILDSNNDLDMAGDTAKPLEKYNPFNLSGEDPGKRGDLFHYEYYQAGRIRKDSSWVRIFDDGNGKPWMMICEHREALLQTGNKQYPLELKTFANLTSYNQYGKITFLDKNSKVIPEKYWLGVGEYLIPDADHYYRIDRITVSGDTVYLRRDRETESLGGTQMGMKALDFTATTLDGKMIRLSDLRGNYVVLDFWGTWCAPCVSFLETLKDIHDTYKDKNLVILGIANDHPRILKRFLRQHPLPWDQIPQYPPDHDSLIKMYKISGYPTTFLIDPSGRIISKKLREDLKEILEQKLMTPVELKTKYLSGNTHFELKGYEYAFPVKVRVYSSHTKGRSFEMIWIDGRWQRNIDLDPGEYTYEFLVDHIRMPDPGNPEKRWTDQCDREISVLQVTGKKTGSPDHSE